MKVRIALPRRLQPFRPKPAKPAKPAEPAGQGGATRWPCESGLVWNPTAHTASVVFIQTPGAFGKRVKPPERVGL